MKTLYSSAFVSMVLGFLMVMGYNNQPVEIVRTEKLPEFATIFEPREPITTDRIQVEVFDGLACDRCEGFFADTLPKIRDLEKESGEVSLHLYFIPDVNDEMMNQAAMALKCAGDQGQFWEMHTKIHGKAPLESKDFGKWAQELKIELKAFKACMENRQFQNEIESDIRYASEKGIMAKPSIRVNEAKLVGAQPFENVQRIIRRILLEQERRENEIKFGDTPTDLQGELQKAFQLPTETKDSEVRTQDSAQNP